MLYYKQIGETSKQFSDRIKNEMLVQKVCLCGKLDPMARGYTNILIDKDTKKMSLYLSSDKEYEFYIVLGISTDSDDILGNISDCKQKIDEHDISTVLNYMNNLTYVKTQKFHHYSAIHLKKGTVNKPLWYWYKQGNLLDDEIPSKNVYVDNVEYIDQLVLDLKRYRRIVLDNLNKVTDPNFYSDAIITSWENFNKISKVILLKYKTRVSSGFYIRMIAKDLKSKGIKCHIYDIYRTNIFEK